MKNKDADVHRLNEFGEPPFVILLRKSKFEFVRYFLQDTKKMKDLVDMYSQELIANRIIGDSACMQLAWMPKWDRFSMSRYDYESEAAQSELSKLSKVSTLSHFEFGAFDDFFENVQNDRSPAHQSGHDVVDCGKKQYISLGGAEPIKTNRLRLTL